MHFCHLTLWRWFHIAHAPLTENREGVGDFVVFALVEGSAPP